MKNNRSKARLILVILIGVLIGTYSSRRIVLPLILGEQYLYFPIVNSSVLPILGVQVDSDYVTQDLIIPNRIYGTVARWMEIEAYRGEYFWTGWVDQNVEWFGNNPIIINAKNTPEWARVWDLDGAPPREEFYDDYARFLIAVCQRYKPWGIEMYNEPDVGIETADPEEQYYFGAWVEGTDFYGAGYRYGQMTKVVYPIFKEKCPDVNLIGGALVGGDNSFEFLRGMQDGGLQADYLSFHQYVFSEKDFDSPFTYSSRLREQTTLPMIMTETSYLDTTDEAKASYIKYIKEQLSWSEIQSALIYNLCGSWRNSALTIDCVPADAYKVWSEQ